MCNTINSYLTMTWTYAKNLFMLDLSYHLIFQNDQTLWIELSLCNGGADSWSHDFDEQLRGIRGFPWRLLPHQFRIGSHWDQLICIWQVTGIDLPRFFYPYCSVFFCFSAVLANLSATGIVYEPFRVLLANRMAKNSAEWQDIFKRYNRCSMILPFKFMSNLV